MTDKSINPIQLSYTLTLTTQTYGGAALGRLPDGRAVFVPYCLPGEVVRVRLVEEKKRYAWAELLEVLEPSPERVQPRCVHFGRCGGCHYQHMPYEDQLKAKEAILRDQLERIGRLSDPPVQPTIPSPREYYYRNHVQFHLRVDGKLGYHEARTNEVFPIQECHLPEELLNDLWPQLDIEYIPGLKRVGLRLGSGEDLMVVLESENPTLPEFQVEDLPVSVVHSSPAGVQVLAGSKHIIMEVLGRLFHVSAGSFFQVNTRIAEKMVEHVLDHFPLLPGDTVLDVYAGVGLFSVFLAPRVGRLIGIESTEAGCLDYANNLSEFDNVELYQGLAEVVLPNLTVKPDGMLVDPPREGIRKVAMDGILALRPANLVYISCDVATLARDSRRLDEGGYKMTKITPFDLFPQTYHIESISFWKLADE